MAGIGNDLYTPTCAASCSDQTLDAVGDTDCANEENLELSEINELYLDEKSATLFVPTNPVTGYVVDTDNSTALSTWKGLVDNSTSSKTRLYHGVGEKPEPQETIITLHRGKTSSIGTRHTLVYTINIIDAVTYKGLRKLQACKGQYHGWFSTDTYFYGGLNGILLDVEKVVFPKTGGRGENAKCIITLGWNAKADPVRDKRTW